MNKLALFCKSYRGDVDRCRLLSESISRHNRDQIPFYLSVPAADLALFTSHLGTADVKYLSDEAILGRPLQQSWVSQQLVKLGFAKLGIAENYLWIDSDFLVIRDFLQTEFFAYADVPYTVMFEARSDIYHDRLIGSLEDDAEYTQMLRRVFASYSVIRDWFGRSGPLCYFGSPAIWSSRVVVGLERHMQERQRTWSEMLSMAPYEMNWYGEFLLAGQSIPVVPRGSLAVCFARDQQFQRFQGHGFTLQDLALRGYLAVGFAAKWMNVPTGPRSLEAAQLRARNARQHKRPSHGP